MIRKQKSARGFIVPEFVLVGVGVVLVAVAGWVVYRHYNQSDAQQILGRQQAIDRAISGLSIRTYNTFGNTLYKKGYLTTSLYNTTQSLINSFASGDFSSDPAYNSLICVDHVPSSFRYGPVSINNEDTAASLPVKVYVPDSPNQTNYTAHWVNNDGTWRMDSAECNINNSQNK